MGVLYFFLGNIRLVLYFNCHFRKLPSFSDPFWAMSSLAVGATVPERGVQEFELCFTAAGELTS